jgi:hypothetical protein
MISSAPSTDNKHMPGTRLPACARPRLTLLVQSAVMIRWLEEAIKLLDAVDTCTNVSGMELRPCGRNTIGENSY